MTQELAASIARLIRSRWGWLFVVLALAGCGAPDLKAVPGATVAPPVPLNPTAPVPSLARTAIAPPTAATPMATKQVDAETTTRAVFPPEAELSADGRWVAYRIDTTVYIRPIQ